MTCADLEARAGGLVALPAHDRERVDAEAHAAGCAACAALLAEAHAVLALIDAAPGLPAPSPEVLARAAAPILAELAGEVAEVRAPDRTPRPQRAVAAWLAGALLAGSALMLAWARRGGRLRGGRSWLATGMVGALALGCLALLRAGASAAGAALAASLGFAFLVGGAGPLEPLVGLGCAASELMTAALPITVALYFVRRGAAPGRAAWFAGIASAGALAGHAHLHLHCPVHTSLAHLLWFHAGGVLLAALLGLGIGQLAQRRG